MTRAEFKAARIRAAQEYITEANKELLETDRTDRQRANALRRKMRAKHQLKVWQREGFWTPETELAYSMIYSKLPSGTPVSAL